MLELEKITEMEIRKNPSIVKKTIDFGGRFIDYKIGAYGALGMGAIVFGINEYISEDTLGSFTAAAKQGAYTFFIGGAITRFSKYLAINIKNKALAITFSCILPSLVSISLTYGMHTMKGTPNPLESTLPTALIIIPGSAVYGAYQRKKNDTYIIDSLL